MNGEFGELYKAIREDILRIESKLDAVIKDHEGRISVLETRSKIFGASLIVVSTAIVAWVIAHLIGI